MNYIRNIDNIFHKRLRKVKFLIYHFLHLNYFVAIRRFSVFHIDFHFYFSFFGSRDWEYGSRLKENNHYVCGTQWSSSWKPRAFRDIDFNQIVSIELLFSYILYLHLNFLYPDTLQNFYSFRSFKFCNRNGKRNVCASKRKLNYIDIWAWMKKKGHFATPIELFKTESHALIERKGKMKKFFSHVNIPIFTNFTV